MTHHIADWQFDPAMSPDRAMRDTGGYILGKTAATDDEALEILRAHIDGEEITGVILEAGPKGYDLCYYPVIPDWNE